MFAKKSGVLLIFCLSSRLSNRTYAYFSFNLYLLILKCCKFFSQGILFTLSHRNKILFSNQTWAYSLFKYAHCSVSRSTTYAVKIFCSLFLVNVLLSYRRDILAQIAQNKPYMEQLVLFLSHSYLLTQNLSSLRASYFETTFRIELVVNLDHKKSVRLTASSSAARRLRLRSAHSRAFLRAGTLQACRTPAGSAAASR